MGPCRRARGQVPPVGGRFRPSALCPPPTPPPPPETVRGLEGHRFWNLLGGLPGFLRPLQAEINLVPGSSGCLCRRRTLPSLPLPRLTPPSLDGVALGSRLCRCLRSPEPLSLRATAMATETPSATRRTRGTVGRQRRQLSPSRSHHRHSLPPGLLTALVLATIPTAAISTSTAPPKACGSVHFAHPAPDLALFRHDTINVTYESSFAHPSLVCLCGQGGRVSES